MFQFLIFAVASVGLTAILVDGKIFAPFRERLAERTRLIREKRERLNLKPTFTFPEFQEGILTCYQCCGFWSGLFCGLFIVTSFSGIGVSGRPFAILNTLMLWFCCGTAGSLLAHIYYWCIELVSALTLLVKNKIHDEHLHAHFDDNAF
ncbi:MAG: hypothetical protein FWC43_03085 [Planctomycetaceae bacterium]|nr:hypothetical protein [Planctomycetaceae bacterium]